jgi:predicted signal transduction protein with EAL and GGDEF domain
MANAAAVAVKLIQALNEPLGVEDRRHQVGASIGIACCPALGTVPRELLRAADLAMYLAKQGGANPAFALPEIPLQTPLQ